MDSAGNWSLPTQKVIGGRLYHLNTDYRDVLVIIRYLQEEPDEQLAAQIALALFYEEYDELPPEDMQAAVDYLFAFIGCFESAPPQPRPKQIDWEQDYNMIAADVNKVAGCEVRSLEYLHWFTFIGFFTSVGDGQLATVVSIRHKVRKHEKLAKWEQEFYQDNRAKIDFKQHYSPEEQAEIDRLNKLIGSR